MTTTEITIRRTGDHVEVIQGDKTTGQLCMGECIEQVIGLIYSEQRKVYPMLTEKEWEDRWAKARQRAKEAAE